MSDQAKNLLDVDPQLINQLIQVTDITKRKSQPAKQAPDYEKLLFPIPETCPDRTNLWPLQTKKFEQLQKV